MIQRIETKKDKLNNLLQLLSVDNIDIPMQENVIEKAAMLSTLETETDKISDSEKMEVYSKELSSTFGYKNQVAKEKNKRHIQNSPLLNEYIDCFGFTKAKRLFD